MKIFITTLVILLMLPVALAVTVTTNPTNAVHDGSVKVIADGCEGITFIRVISPGGTLVNAYQGLQPFEVVYNTNNDPSAGTYQARVSCAGTTGEAMVNFCVDTICETVVDDTPTPSGGSPGGGRRCTSAWDCGPWDYCNATLEQSRTCVDTNNCQANKVEVQECDECKESWVCGLWSDCINGKNLRTCVDEYSCGTTVLKPWLSKTCGAIDSGPPPRSINQQTPPPYVAPEVQQPQPVSFWQNAWDKYKAFIIAIPSALVLIILITLLVIHFIPKGKMVYNLDELKDWIKKEQAMGTSNEDIHKILAQHTGWQEQEIHEAFTELHDVK